MFHMLDENKDGKLSRLEIHNGIDKLGLAEEATMDAHLSLEINWVGKKEEGSTINREQFHEMCGMHAGHPMEIFDTCDKDKSGMIS